MTVALCPNPRYSVMKILEFPVRDHWMRSPSLRGTNHWFAPKQVLPLLGAQLSTGVRMCLSRARQFP